MESPMTRMIMVPLDGFPLAERALPMAVRLAKRAHARLHLVHALDMLMRPQFIDRTTAEQFWREGAAQGAHDYLERIAARIRLEQQIPVTTTVVDAPIVTALTAEARRMEADLVIMMTHGRGPFGRMWMGSVADGFARQAPCPIVFVRPDVELEPPLRHILVPIDGSEISEELVGPAAELAALEGGQLTLLHIAHPSAVPAIAAVAHASVGESESEEVAGAATNYLTEVALREINAECEWRVDVVSSDLSTAGEILRYATERHIDLIAIATHGHGGVRRLLMGSVADKVLRGASVPVMLYRPGVHLSSGEGEL